MARLFVATAKAIVIFSDGRQHGFQAVDFASTVPFCRPGNPCLQVAISQVERRESKNHNLKFGKWGPSTLES